MLKMLEWALLTFGLLIDFIGMVVLVHLAS